MRKLLLASAAIIGATGGLAHAQAPAPPRANPSQGQLAAPFGAGPAANNNNNSWGTANTPTGSAAAGPLSTVYAPNVDAVPAPGTIVIRLNGRVEVDLTADFTSLDKGRTTTGAPSGYKLNPLGISSYARLYPAFDGVAANGLRYGATIELRTNFGPADRPFATSAASGAANSPSANTSAETIFVRRVFSYLAADNVGIVRFGQGDGVIGLFDNCIFTTQCWDGGVGNFNGGALQDTTAGGGVGIPFVWLAQAGADYGNSKVVYLSPQVYGFDFGIQYAPNEGNTYQNSGLGVGCNQANSTCIGVSSGNDPSRWINQVGGGLRYQQVFGPVDFKAYGFGETSGKENLTTAAYTTPAVARAGTGGASALTLRYDNLGFYKAGVAVTAFNVTAAADYIGGAVNGQLALRPSGGVNTNAVVTGLTYANGPITLGAEVGLVDTQGDPRLVGVSQRHEYEVAFGGSYRLAPGVVLVGEYMYTHRHQGGFDFANNNVGVGGRTVDAQGQGGLFSTVLFW
ncbi:porin [Rhodopila sp.]|uniref:porin n=1 Tax=Rhodopila sp. TaxID=2480087 RepID=UPI003D0BC6BB